MQKWKCFSQNQSFYTSPSWSWVVFIDDEIIIYCDYLSLSIFIYLFHVKIMHLIWFRCTLNILMWMKLYRKLFVEKYSYAWRVLLVGFMGAVENFNSKQYDVEMYYSCRCIPRSTVASLTGLLERFYLGVYLW